MQNDEKEVWLVFKLIYLMKEDDALYLAERNMDMPGWV